MYWQRTRQASHHYKWYQRKLQEEDDWEERVLTEGREAQAKERAAEAAGD
jgi:hypothetical protein